MRRATPQREIAVCPSLANTYGRAVLHGVLAYAREKLPGWAVLRVGVEDLQGADLFDAHRIAGIIVHHPAPPLIRRLLALRRPVIDVSSRSLDSPFPHVIADDHAIGRMVADYLMGCGHRSFAFCGARGSDASGERAEGFSARLAERGFQASIQAISEPPWHGPLNHEEDRTLRAWLRTLRKPVGLMASFDRIARRVAEISRDLGLTVPDEIALVGVDNDEIETDISPVPLSTVDPGARQIGWVAADWLARLIAGTKPPAAAVRVPPLNVIPRRSSDRLVVSDPVVARALDYIRTHYRKSISVGDLVSRLGVSRRALERRFHRSVGTSPHAEITLQRIARAKELLLTTRLSHELIAAEAGFVDGRHMGLVFRARVGLTPRRFRQRHAAEMLTPG